MPNTDPAPPPPSEVSPRTPGVVESLGTHICPKADTILYWGKVNKPYETIKKGTDGIMAVGRLR